MKFSNPLSDLWPWVLLGRTPVARVCTQILDNKDTDTYVFQNLWFCIGALSVDRWSHWYPNPNLGRQTPWHNLSTHQNINSWDCTRMIMIHTCTMHVKIFKLCMLCINLICNLNMSKIHNCRHKVLKSAKTVILKMKRYARYLRYCGNQFIQNAVRLSLQLSALGFQNQIFFKPKP